VAVAKFEVAPREAVALTNERQPLRKLISKIVELSISVQGSVWTRCGRQNAGGSDVIKDARIERIPEI